MMDKTPAPSCYLLMLAGKQLVLQLGLVGILKLAPLAQLVEQLTLNQLVQGSSP